MSKHKLTGHKKAHPVADHFAKHIVDAFGAIPDEHDARKAREAIFRKSNADPSSITAKDRKILEAATSVLNMHAAAKHLGDRDLEDVFGPGTTICQVHGNSVGLPCGCIVHHFFDHHKRHEEEKVFVPHKPIRVCEDHAHLAKDFKAHYAAVHPKG